MTRVTTIDEIEQAIAAEETISRLEIAPETPGRALHWVALCQVTLAYDGPEAEFASHEFVEPIAA